MQTWIMKLFGIEEMPRRRKRTKRKVWPPSMHRDMPGPRIEGRDIPQGKKLSFTKYDQLKRGL